MGGELLREIGERLTVIRIYCIKISIFNGKLEKQQKFLKNLMNINN